MKHTSDGLLSSMTTATSSSAHQALLDHPHTFLQPTSDLHTSFLHLAKQFLDPLASDVTDAQIRRQQEQRSRKTQKRKRDPDDDGDRKTEMLRMKKVHVDGFEVDQVWQQARRILEAANDEVERELPKSEDDEDDDDEDAKRPVKSVRFDEEGFEMGDSDDSDQLGEEGIDYEVEGEDVDDLEDEEDDDMDGFDETRDDYMDDDDDESLDIGDETPESDLAEDTARQKTYVKDPNGLNDGFFSIDDFNKQSQFLEQQDERGEDDGAASDEEEVDWGTDPFAIDPRAGQKTSKKGQSRQRQRPQTDEEDEDDDDDEEGPTFGDMALDAPEGESDIDMDEEGDIDDDDMGAGGYGNANDIMYADFFAPPAKAGGKKKSKSSKPRKPRASTTLATEDDADADNAALQRTMSAVHRDLFNDDPSSDDDDADLSPDEYDAAIAAEDKLDSTLPSRTNLSTHERRQLALRQQIRRLEAENVAAKPWYLNGESLSASRPENALLEEDLEFERAGKPVPLVTEETNEDIEALIKRRILSRTFDEIVRRRPGEGDLNPAANARRGKVAELSDQKSARGLAEEYESDLLARTDPNYVDTRTEALKAQHRAIEGLWADVSARLDALSNWHYKPKPAAASLEVKVDVPTVALEDVRPTTGADVGTSVLAPQEVFLPGQEEGGEGGALVRTKGGSAVAREEMSREQKVRRRRREKERARKAGANASAVAEKTTQSGNVVGDVAKGSGKNLKGERKAESQREVQEQLKRGGARIIDRKGALRDVAGDLAKERRTGVGGVGALKL